MAERYRVVVVGRPKVRWAQAAVDDYSKRIRRLGGVCEHGVRAERFTGQVEPVRDAEGARILAAASGSLICLDERGDALDSEGFAALLDRTRQLGSVSFAIGGAYGHAPAVRDAAHATVRLSSMVLNHELARVVLYEQLYRGLTILEGIPYHH